MRQHTAVRTVAARFWGLIALLALLMTACSSGGGSPTVAPAPSATATTPEVVATPTTTPSATATSTASPEPGTPTSTPATPTSTPAATPAPSAPVAFQVETFASGLVIPWEMAFLPGGRILVTERPGDIRLIEDGKLRDKPFATINEVSHEGEAGLLGMALHPDFAANHWLYVYYSYYSGGSMMNKVVRYTATDDGLTEPTTIIERIPGANIHDGGRLAFGPDGKLYITTGDAAQPDLSQDLKSLAGKILRVNPDGSIPDDNPFPGSPVYSYGHRNPEGLAWQPGTNQLYATEHGPSGHDEVNKIEPGKNYGWPQMRGNEGPGDDDFTGPVVESGSGTWAPSGGTFVRGDTFPQFRDTLLYGGLRSTTLWQLDVTAESPEPRAVIKDEYGRLREVVEGPDGMLYILTSNRDGRGTPAANDDRILRLVPKR